MFEKGLIDEVRALWERGDCHTDLPAIRAVGYRQVWSLLNGEIDGTTCRQQILAATRQLAKRQLTWLRSWPDLTWMITDAEGALVRSLESDVKGPSGNENTRLKGYEARWTQRIEAFFRNF